VQAEVGEQPAGKVIIIYFRRKNQTEVKSKKEKGKGKKSEISCRRYILV
jgi:hypothetical protein